MPQINHRNISAEHNHVIHSSEVASLAALNAMSVSAIDVGRVAKVADTQLFYILKNHSPATWVEIAAGGTMSPADKTKLDDLIVGTSTQRSKNYLSKNRILVNNGGVIECEGVPIREMGICAPTLLTEYQEAGTQKFLTEFPLIAQTGVRFVRLRATALFPNGWQSGYFANKELFYSRTLQVLDAAKEHGLGVVLSLFWRAATLSDLTNEDVEAGFATPGSATRTLAATVVDEFTTKFASHPAVAAWEIGNEYSLFAANGATPSVRVEEGTPASYTAPADVMTLSTMRNFYTFFETEIKKKDTTNRIIMTGNGGPAGQIEKSLANYLTLLPLDNPVDTWTMHKYARNDFGNRAYADLYDTLTTIRKAALLAGKPLILGEFGQERNETYGGFGGLPVFRTACQAIYQSGVQLAFAWEWSRTDSTTTVWDFAFHPDNITNGTYKFFDVLKYYNERMRDEGYVSPTGLVTSAPITRTGQAAFGTGTTVQIPASTILNSGFGFCISFWVKKTRDDLSNRKIMHKYGTNTGWFVGYGASPNSSIYAQVQWSDGTTLSTNNQTTPQYVADGWVHYVFQLDQNTSSPTAGFTVYQNGVWIKSLATTKTFNHSPSNLLFFAEAGGASASHVGLKEVRMHSRALTDVEARNLYLYGVSPQSITIGEWDFNGSLTDSTVNANHGTATTGTVTYNSF